MKSKLLIGTISYLAASSQLFAIELVNKSSRVYEWSNQTQQGLLLQGESVNIPRLDEEEYKLTIRPTNFKKGESQYSFEYYDFKMHGQEDILGLGSITAYNHSIMKNPSSTLKSLDNMKNGLIHHRGVPESGASFVIFSSTPNHEIDLDATIIHIWNDAVLYPYFYTVDNKPTVDHDTFAHIAATLRPPKL